MYRKDLPYILFDQIHKVEPYPDTVSPIHSMINGTAFFSGGNGLWMEGKTDTFPSILVLGQDFSTLKEYMKMLKGDSNDLNCPTWRNIIRLFNQAGVNLNECFFSNVFMGLRNTDSMVGKFPGFKDKEFLQRNIEFLSYQIEIIKPRIIITLGIYAVKMLSKLSPDDLAA